MVEATDNTEHISNDALKTAILAGSGRLPELVADELFRRGNPPLCVSIDGEAGAWIGRFDHLFVKSIAIGHLVRALKSKEVKQVALAGGIRARPSLWSIRPDWVTLSNFFRFYKALGKGDDGLLRGVIEMLEEQGFKVVGAHDIMPTLIAPKGVLTRRQPTEDEKRDRDLALAAALSAGRDDLGQAAVAAAGEVIAIEDVTGTDAMLILVQARRAGAGIAASCGVLAKAAKPQQEHRADLPSIGPETVDNAVRAGLTGIAVSAGSSLILDRKEVIKRADAAGIFVEGCAVGAKR
jgi:UDP-2,3-diacylglucosamine hydrolase